MWKKEWDSSYVGFTTDGADWLVKNTNVKFVGKNLWICCKGFTRSTGIIR